MKNVQEDIDMNKELRGFIVAVLCSVFAVLFPIKGYAGAEPILTVTPLTVAFGNRLVDTTSANRAITVSNTGTAAMTINGITLGGANPGQFRKTTTCGATLASGATCTVRVKFAPTTSGAKSVAVNVDVAAPAVSTTITLTGTGTKPVLAVTPSMVDFGNRTVGTTSANSVITVRNTGTAAMAINNITLGGMNPDQFSNTTTCGATLASGATCTINVKFKPTLPGAKSASLDVNVALPAASKSVTLTGTGTAPVLAVSPHAVEFDNRLISTSSATQMITVQNFGSANLTIDGIALVGPNPGQFSKTTTCGSHLASGATCTVNVKFKPTAAGAKSATININVAAPAISQAVTLTGRGVLAVAAPLTPTGVVAFAGMGVVGLTWDAVDDATVYNIYWSTLPGVTTENGTKIANIKKPFYKHKNLAAGTTYYYIITAANPVGESAPSLEASAHVPRLKKMSLSNTVGMVMQYTTYTYDGDGRLEKVTSYGATGVISNYVVYEYDSEGRPTKLSTYDFADQLIGYTTMEYNGDGKVVKTSIYGPTGFLMQYTTTQYTDAGKPSLIAVYGSTGVLSTYTTYEYTYAYHEAGDVTRTVTYGFGDFLIGYTTTDYNTEGKKISVTSYGPTGLLSKQTRYEYNDAGQEVKVSHYNLTGLTDYTTTEYDADGNEIMKKKYDFADILTGYTTMEYNGVGLPVDISNYGPTGLLKERMTFEYE
jgi:hypothetical protein